MLKYISLELAQGKTPDGKTCIASGPPKHYVNASLGEIAVSSSGSTVFDFGEWKSEVGSRKNPDGAISFITTVPGMDGAEFVVGAGAKRTLIIRDAQHEYVFEER
jgi:hypothetical protein